MARGSAQILDDDEEIDLATFMLDACGIDYTDFYMDERILTRENFEKNFKFIKRMVDNRSFRRAPYFVLGYFILITGSKMPEDLRLKILKASEWHYEEGCWFDKGHEIERKIYLNDFREKIRQQMIGQRLHPIRLIYLDGKNDLYTKNRHQTIIGFKELQETGSSRKIKHVLLQGWGLKSIPKKVFKIKSLETLSLDFNLLSLIPEKISELVNLRLLFLSYNNFKEFPKTITELPSLETLSLSNNYISLLPESIHKIKTLNTLNIRKNNISQIPAYLKNKKFKLFYD